MRNATSIGLFGASALALTILGACGGGGGSHDDGASGSGNSTAGNNTGTAGNNTGTAGNNTGTAGSSTGTAGAGTAGSGSGGAPACAMTPGSKSGGDGTNTTIDELDDTNIMFAPAGTGAGAWDFGKDNGAMAMGTITPTGTTTLMPIAGGHMGSALHVSGTGLTGWGASLAAFLNGAMGSFDCSAYGGVAFWIKGTTDVQEGKNKLMVQARMPDVLPGAGSCCVDPPPGGMPTGIECYSGHRTVIDVPTDWAEVKIPWSAFMGPAWGLGSTIPLNPNRIRDINFSFNHDTAMKDKPASFDVWVDGLRFMKKDEMGNVGGGTGGSGGGGSGGGSGGSGGASGGAGSGGGGTGGTGGTN